MTFIIEYSLISSHYDNNDEKARETPSQIELEIEEKEAGKTLINQIHVLRS